MLSYTGLVHPLLVQFNKGEVKMNDKLRLVWWVVAPPSTTQYAEWGLSAVSNSGISSKRKSI